MGKKQFYLIQSNFFSFLQAYNVVEDPLVTVKWDLPNFYLKRVSRLDGKDTEPIKYYHESLGIGLEFDRQARCFLRVSKNKILVIELLQR